MQPATHVSLPATRVAACWAWREPGLVARHCRGEFVLAFTNVGRVPHRLDGPMLEARAVIADSHPFLDLLFQAAVESVQEAVVNALSCAETMAGHNGHE
jgi:D-aminopeptidase